MLSLVQLPASSPIFGTAAELFSEAKLSALFGIDVRIRTLDFDGRQTPVVAAVS